MSLKYSFFLAVLLTAVPATAQDSGNATHQPEAKEKKICRRAASTGSIMSKSVCRTRAEWKLIDEENSRNNEAFRDRPNAGQTRQGL